MNQFVTKKLKEIGRIKETDEVEFIPQGTAAFERNDYGKNQKYIILVNGDKKFLLRSGKDIKLLYEKYILAAKLLSEIIPTVYIAEQSNEDFYLVEEFIEGETLESILIKNPEKEKEWVDKVLSFHEELNNKKIKSTYESVVSEIDFIFDKILELDFLTETDSDLIGNIVRREVISLVSQKTSFYKRVVQGDFIDRNIIVTSDGRLRLIDLEFAKDTHFFLEEKIRFFEYSNSLKNHSIEKQTIDILDEIMFYINQLYLVISVHKNYIHTTAFDAIMYKIFTMIRDNSSSYKHSRIVKFLNADYWEISQKLNQKEMELQQVKLEILTIKNSRAWKIGFFITSLMKKITSISRWK